MCACACVCVHAKYWVAGEQVQLLWQDRLATTLLGLLFLPTPLIFSRSMCVCIVRCTKAAAIPSRTEASFTLALATSRCKYQI